MAATTGLTINSPPEKYVEIIDGLKADIEVLKAALARGTPATSAGGVGLKKLNLVNEKGIVKVPSYGGDEKDFRDLEFKLQHFSPLLMATSSCWTG